MTTTPRCVPPSASHRYNFVPLYEIYRINIISNLLPLVSLPFLCFVNLTQSSASCPFPTPFTFAVCGAHNYFDLFNLSCRVWPSSGVVLIRIYFIVSRPFPRASLLPVWIVPSLSRLLSLSHFLFLSNFFLSLNFLFANSGKLVVSDAVFLGDLYSSLFSCAVPRPLLSLSPSYHSFIIFIIFIIISIVFCLEKQ